MSRSPLGIMFRDRTTDSMAQPLVKPWAIALGYELRMASSAET